jgi:hypothetical protein
MALSSGPRQRWLRFGASALLSLAFACGDDAPGATEVLLSLDAREGARDAELLRVQVNAAVVELERKRWPVELLIRPKGGDASRGVMVRAFAMDDGQVLGAVEANERFRKGQRKQLRLTLDPAVQLGAPPAVNTQVDPDGVVSQPDPDAGNGSADEDAGAGAAMDGSATCGADGCGDAAVEDACVPSPEACGECGPVCGEGTECLAGSCEPLPPADCKNHVFERRIYSVCTDARSWESARTACRDRSMDLVVIDSTEENAFVLGIAGDDAWIGASDRGEDGSNCKRSEDEGSWYWVDPTSGNERGEPLCAFTSSSAGTCSPATERYTAWRAGEPDNDGCTCSLLGPLLGTKCSEGSDCAAISPSDGSWIDGACDSAKRYVCESRASP